MDDNRFFKWVWRLNGLMIAVAAVLAIGIMLYIAAQLYREVTRERAVVNDVMVETGHEVRQDWVLGSFSEVCGHPVLMAGMMQNQNYRHSHYSESVAAIRNFLFINTETSESLWLFDHTRFLVETKEGLRRGSCNSKSPIEVIVYQLIKEDTSGDGRLSIADARTLAITRPDGSGYVEVVAQIDDFREARIVSDDKLFLLYDRQGSLYSMAVNLPTFEALEEMLISRVGKN